MSRVRSSLALALTALLLLLASGAGVVFAVSSWRLNRRFAVEPRVPAGIADPAARSRGAHLAQAVLGCPICHGPDLGGGIYMDAGAIGLVAGPNLTAGRGGIARSLDREGWVRAIRHGVRADGTSLLVMPSETYVHLGESDLAALLAYLETLPPVDRDVPRSRLGWQGRLLLATGRLPVLVAEKTPALPYPEPVAPAPTAAYGRYLATISGCHGCHGFGLSGGRVAGPPGLPPAPNLTAHPDAPFARWTESDFVRAMREGRRPDGSGIDPFMPWPTLGRMTDEELRALWVYLRSAPARPGGGK